VSYNSRVVGYWGGDDGMISIAGSNIDLVDKMGSLGVLYGSSVYWNSLMIY